MRRDRYLDFLRALAIGCVVVRHWLITDLTRRDGAWTAPELLATVPWPQWLTRPGLRPGPTAALRPGPTGAGRAEYVRGVTTDEP